MNVRSRQYALFVCKKAMFLNLFHRVFNLLSIIKNMKILMTTCGGVVRDVKWWEYLISREFIKRGHDVTVLTSTSVMKVFPSAKREEVIDGINVKRFHPLSPAALKWMLRNDFDVIDTDFPGYIAPLSSWAAIRKRMKDIPMVQAVHGLYHDPYLVEDVEDPFSKPIKYDNMQREFSVTKAANWFCHLPIFTADRVFALNKFEKQELIKFGVLEEKIDVVPNGIDLKQYNKKTKDFKKKMDIGGEMILFVGQPIRRKGPEYLLASMPYVLKEFPDATLVFIGYKRNESLESIYKELNLGDSVRFLGFVSEDDKVAAFRSCDVFCMPSNYEGLGIVYLESMACGVPIVTTNTPGIADLVEPRKNGLLVPPKNPKKIAQAIIEILSDRNLGKRMRRNNTKKVKNFSVGNVAKKTLAIYEEIL